MRDWSPDRIRVVMELLDLQPSSLAAELGVTARAVGYWLAGQRSPTAPHALAGLGRLESEAVARLAQPRGKDGPVQRKQLLEAVVGVPLALYSGLLHPRSAGRPVDERYVAVLEHVTTSLESGYAFATPNELIDSAFGQYQTLMRLMDRAATTVAHRRLQVATGKTALLMALLARDGGAWSWSKHFTNQALDLGLEAAHGGLEASALSNLGYLLSSRFGDGSRADPRRSLSYAQQAHTVAERWSPPAMRSWSATELAKAHAVMGHTSEALEAAEHSRLSFSADVGGDDLGGRFIGVWSEATWQRASGACHLVLGRLDEAEGLFRAALSGDLSPRTRSHALTDLASVFVARAEPEQACDALSRAYTEAVRMESQASLQRILRVRQDLAPWAGEPCVRDLDDRLGA